MALNILPKEYTSSEQISNAFSTGLSNSLQQLLGQMAQNRALEMQSTRITPALQQLLGLSSHEEASKFAPLAIHYPELIKPLISERAKTQFQPQGPGIEQFFQGLSPEQIQAFKAAEPGVQGIIAREIIENPSKYLRGNNQPSKQETNLISKLSPLLEQQQLNQSVEPLIGREKEADILNDAARILQLTEGRQPEAAPEINKDISQLRESKQLNTNIPAEEAILKPKTEAQYMAEGLSRTEARERLKEDRQIAKEKRMQKHELDKLKLDKESEGWKYNKDIINDAVNGKIEAKRILEDLERLEQLEPELDTPGYSEFLKRSGLNIPALMNPGSEEFNKVITNFQRGAKDVYGGRITNFELESFMQSIPSLSQSPEGRKRVIANLRRFYQGKRAYAETLEDVIEAHDGVPPLSLTLQIGKKIENKLDKISEQFRKDLAKPVPEGQNKFITATQSVLGSLASAPGKILNNLGKLSMF